MAVEDDVSSVVGEEVNVSLWHHDDRLTRLLSREEIDGLGCRDEAFTEWDRVRLSRLISR